MYLLWTRLCFSYMSQAGVLDSWFLLRPSVWSERLNGAFENDDSNRLSDEVVCMFLFSVFRCRVFLHSCAGTELIQNTKCVSLKRLKENLKARQGSFAGCCCTSSPNCC